MADKAAPSSARRVAVVNQAGDVGTLPIEEAGRAFADGARPATAEELAAAYANANVRAAQKHYGGVGGMALAAGAGLARSLSGGTSDELALGVTEALEGRTEREHLRKALAGSKAANPITSVLAEGVGAIAPLIATGGASAAVEGAELAANAARVGEGAEAIGAALRGGAKVARAVAPETSVAEAISSSLARATRGAVHEGEFVEGLRGLRAAPEAAEVVARAPELGPAYRALGAGERFAELGAGERGLARAGAEGLERAGGLEAEAGARALPGEAPRGLLGEALGRPGIADAEFEELGAEAPHAPAPAPEVPPGPAAPPELGAAPPRPPEPGINWDLGPDTRGIPEAPPPTGGSRIAAALRGVGVGPRAIGAAGDLAEGLAGRLVGTGAESMAGRAAQAAARIGARGAVEGGLFNVGQQLSEDSLGNHETTAEKLVAAFGHGALFGAAAGGITGALGSAASDGVGALFRKLSQGRGPGLMNAAGENAWRALDPLKKYSMKAERTAGGIAEVGKTLIAEGVIPADEALGRSALKAEDLLPRVSAAKERIGAQIGDILSQSTATVGAKELFSPIHEIVAKVQGKAGFEGVTASLEAYRRSLAEKLGFLTENGVAKTDLRVRVQDLVEQRRALDELVYKESKALDPNLRVGLLREVRGVMHRVELEAIDRAAAAGSPGAAELRALNKKFQHLSIAEDAANETQARMATNRQLSLSDNMAMMGAAGSSIASGHPLAALAAPALGFAHKWVRQHGNALAASALAKMSRLEAAQAIVAKADQRIASGVEGLFATSRAPAKAARAGWRVLTSEKSETRAESYAKQATRIASFANDPQQLSDAVHAQLGDLGTHAPNVNGAAAVTAGRITSYLQSVLPVAANANDPWAAMSKPRVSHSEIDGFEKRMRGATDPLGVADDMAHGDVSREEIEAVKACYPRIYEQMQGQALGHLMKASEPPPYLTRVKLGSLLEIPADVMLAEKMLAEITKALTPKQHGGKKASPSGGISNAEVRLAGQLETETDRLEGGGQEAA